MARDVEQFGEEHMQMCLAAMADGIHPAEIAEHLIADATALLVNFGGGHADAIDMLRVCADRIEAKMREAN